jgi:hypothetical protein
LRRIADSNIELKAFLDLAPSLVQGYILVL